MIRWLSTAGCQLARSVRGVKTIVNDTLHVLQRRVNSCSNSLGQVRVRYSLYQECKLSPGPELLRKLLTKLKGEAMGSVTSPQVRCVRCVGGIPTGRIRT